MRHAAAGEQRSDEHSGNSEYRKAEVHRGERYERMDAERSADDARFDELTHRFDHAEKNEQSYSEADVALYEFDRRPWEQYCADPENGKNVDHGNDCRKKEGVADAQNRKTDKQLAKCYCQYNKVGFYVADRGPSRTAAQLGQMPAHAVGSHPRKRRKYAAAVERKVKSRYYSHREREKDRGECFYHRRGERRDLGGQLCEHVSYRTAEGGVKSVKKAGKLLGFTPASVMNPAALLIMPLTSSGLVSPRRTRSAPIS